MDEEGTDDTAAMARVDLDPVVLPSNDVRVYEYGVRLDPESAPLADAQIVMARRLYNEIVAAMRQVHAEMSQWVLERAGEEAIALNARAEQLFEAFRAAKAANDPEAMALVASERHSVWRDLAAHLSATRKTHATELRTQFYSRIDILTSSITGARPLVPPLPEGRFKDRFGSPAARRAAPTNGSNQS